MPTHSVGVTCLFEQVSQDLGAWIMIVHAFFMS